MCRLLFYLGSPVVLSHLLTEPENSLINQSARSREREEPLNGDGFGLAWYTPHISQVPGVFRSVTPAWSNRNLLHLAQATASGCILAHVRAASEVGSVAENNCHPFIRGRLAFMHNGDLAGFRKRRRLLLAGLSDAGYAQIEGSTDSEYLFAYFLDHYDKDAEADTKGTPTERLARALVKTLAHVAAHTRDHGAGEHSYINIAVSDGAHAVVSRYTTDDPENCESLHLHTGKTYACIDGKSVMRKPQDGRGAVIVSSEMLSDDKDWRTIPPNQLVIVTSDRSVTVRAI